MQVTSNQQYFEHLRRWLDLESHAERERMAARRKIERAGDVERTGETILNLGIVDHRTGLAGRILMDFSKVDGKRLPLNRLKVGAPVVLSDQNDPGDQGLSGVVSRRKGDSIQVALEQWPDAERYRLDLSPDETTRRRQLAAMGIAQTLTGSRSRLRDVLHGFQEPRFDDEQSVPFVSHLNPPQEDAVRFALAARDLAIVHGPPGTGKTTTLAEIILHCVKRGERVLACAPSNTAVDNLLEKLIPLVPNVIRIGHPARVFEALRGHTLDELVEQDRSTQVVRDLWREVDELMRAASKFSRSREANRRRGELYAEAGRLRQQARSLERATVKHIIESADVICATTTVDEELLQGQEFNTLVVDEACQCTEAAIWPAMLKGGRIVLAGDHCQLPPTVVSAEAAQEGFAVSMMERLIEHFGDPIFRRLKVQYRMPESIMQFPSEEFYDGDLVADSSVRQRSLQDLEGVEENEVTLPVVEYWDTAGAEWEEELEPDGLSKRNPREATWIVDQIRQLLESGLQPEHIAVIAPYAAQVRLIRNRLEDSAIEVDTVDGFQGREKEAVLVSLVRSNERQEIGFLADTRRTNVAITRAKRALRIIGDSSTLATHPFYRKLVEYFESKGAYHSVWELGG